MFITTKSEINRLQKRKGASFLKKRSKKLLIKIDKVFLLPFVHKKKILPLS